MATQEQEYVSAVEAAALLNLDESRVRRLCYKGMIAGAVKRGARWQIPTPIVRLSVSDLAQAGEEEVLISATEAAGEIGVTRQWMSILISEDRVVGARQYGRFWMVPTPVVVLPPKEKADEQS